MLSSQQFEHASKLFLMLRGRAEAERLDLLHGTEDHAVHAEVLRLLASDDSRGSFLSDPLPIGSFFETGTVSQPAGSAALRDGAAGSYAVPLRVARYSIVRVIGAGGTGVVYEARQEQPARPVAVKVLRLALVSESDARRFRREAELLGRLQHPGIAAVFAAGVGEVQYAGGAAVELPYFAMELVEGVTLTQFAQERRLSTRARIELFNGVADAVQHAHQRRIVHCDLKPANVLVDASGRPRVLDFGVAMLLETDAALQTLAVEAARIVGTLPYMAPEQLRGDLASIDVRADVYSLGVVLYELLSGRLPHDVAGASLAQALAAVQAGAHRPLSATAASLRGDLETIVHKAIAPDAARRYQSVAELADDLRRFLRSEPILARAGGALYHAARFVRRRRGLVAAAALTFTALVVGGSAAVGSAIHARAAAQQALAAREESDAVGDFLVNMLTSVDPDQFGYDVRVREVLDAAAESVGRRSAGQPVLEARLRDTIGRSYKALGNLVAAGPQLERAYALRVGHLGPDHLLTLQSALELADVRLGAGGGADALELVESAIAGRSRQLGPDHPATLEALSGRASLLKAQRKFEEAEPVYQQVIDGLASAGQATSNLSLDVRSELAEMYALMRRYGDAERLLGEVIEAADERFGEDALRAVAPTVRLAELYIATGRIAEAEPLALAALETHRRRLGDENHLTLRVMYALANIYQRQQRLDEAEKLLVQLEAAARKVLGEQHPNVGTTQAALGDLTLRLGRLEESRGWLDRALSIQRAVRGAHPDLATSLEFLGRLEHAQGNHAAAVAAFDEAVEIRGQTGRGPDSGSIARARACRGAALIELGRLQEAEADLLAAFATMKKDPTRGEVYQLTLDGLIDCYTRGEKPELAAEYRALKESQGR